MSAVDKVVERQWPADYQSAIQQAASLRYTKQIIWRRGFRREGPYLRFFRSLL